MEDFKAVIDQYYPILYKIGRSFTGNKADFDDLYQEMLIQLYHSINSFRGNSKPSTWIYRVALNTALTFNRNNNKKNREVKQNDLRALENKPDSDPDSVATEQKIELLYACINELRNDEKALILLHLEEKQYDEIAEITGLSKSNVGVKLLRTKKHLQKLMKEKGYEQL